MRIWPRISVITPSFNQGRFLEETIRSVLDQDYPNLEYIVIDGGSTDNSVDIIKKYAKKLAVWVSEPDRGQSDALNRGFRIASGEIVGWLNSDDVYLEKSLYTAARYFTEYPTVDLIYGNYFNIDENSRVVKICYDLPYSFWRWAIGGIFFCQPASFFRRSVFDRIGYLNVDLHYCMDNEFFYRMFRAGCKFKHVDEFMAKFRYHHSSKAVAGQKETKNALFEIWADNYGTGKRSLDKCFYVSFQLFLRAIRAGNNLVRNHITSRRVISG